MRQNNRSARADALRVATRKTLLERLQHPKDTAHWQGSWQEFLENYWGLIFGFARRLGLSEDEAKDVVQETVLCVMQKIGAYEYQPERARFSSWLGGIVFRKALKERTKRKRMEQLLTDIDSAENDDSVPLEQIPDATADVCEKWQKEWEQHLWALATQKVKEAVSAEQYQMFDYHIIQEHTAEETARCLDTTANAVYSAASRVRALIKEEIERLRKQPL